MVNSTSHINRCSIKILHPIKTSIIPPNSSALLSNLLPNLFPILTPSTDKPNVITPIHIKA